MTRKQWLPLVALFILTLIVFWVLPAACGNVAQGQTDLTVVGGNGITPDSLFKITMPQHTFTVVTLEDWREYKAWCYADSMLTKGGIHSVDGRHYYWSEGLPAPWEHWVGWKREDRYTHRNPTFLDFMEWLDRRNK